MTAKGNTASHVAQTCRRLEQVIADCHAKQISDLSGSAVLVAIGTLRDDGTSLRTCNAYLRSIKSFTRWLRREKRTADDALAGLSQFNEATDRRDTAEVVRGGIEPPTHGFSVHCSTN